jgi:hypothetical protein
MALDKGKHTAGEINGIRCTVVDKEVTRERASFLKELLASNDFEVQVEEEKKTDETSPERFTVGVTDLVFNPVIAVYQMRLRTQDGKKVSPAYWNQWSKKQVDNRYWRYYRKGDKHEINEEEYAW